jgi:hypothetical protein
MNSEHYAFVLECKDNPREIALVLGYAASQRTFDSQQMWPTEMWPLGVLCQVCLALFEYTEQDIQTVPVHSMDPATRQPTKTWCIEVLCGRESCGSLTKMHFQAGIGSLREHVLGKIRGTPISCRECGQTNRIEDRFCKSVRVVGSSGSS